MSGSCFPLASSSASTGGKLFMTVVVEMREYEPWVQFKCYLRMRYDGAKYMCAGMISPIPMIV